MVGRLWNATSLFIITALVAVQCEGQITTEADSSLGVIQKLYDNGMFVSSELEARRLLEQPAFPDTVKMILERHIAFSLVAQGKPQSAVDHFLMVLTYNPNFDLDPILTSPKILSTFNEAKLKFLSRKPRGSIAENDLMKSTIRPISFRTLIFPGWEQLYQGRTTSGYLFLGSGALTVGLSLFFEIQRREARQEYLSASSSATAQNNYSAYNSYYKAEIYSALAFAVLYLASELDVVLDSYVLPSPVPSGQATSTQRLTVRIPI